MKLAIIKNVFYNWTGMIAIMLYAFFMVPLVVHGLGNTCYGIWNLVIACIG